MVLMVGVVCFGQENPQMDSIIREIQTVQRELLNVEFYLDGIYKEGDRPRFKMYQTENIYTLLKLDTRTGQVWQVQYGMNDVVACTKTIYYNNYYSSIIREDEGFDGRFELYPTKNMYNFILLDTYKGETYQVQWNIDPYKRFIIKIE